MLNTRIHDRSALHYPPQVLREYALLADGERGALIGPCGDVAWMCAPRWDSDAVFAALIGGHGMYAVSPADSRYVWGGYYEEGSLIWHSRWTTEGGVIECREALAFPGDPERLVLLRRLIAVGSGHAAALTKGRVSLTLTGQGEGWDIGAGLSGFTIHRAG